MTMIDDGPTGAPVTILLAHGAGAPMDSPAMTQITQTLTENGLRVVRFEFAYMAARRAGGPKRPPSAQARLLEEWKDVAIEVSTSRPRHRVFVGGKSLGGLSRLAGLTLMDPKWMAVVTNRPLSEYGSSAPWQILKNFR